MGDNLPVIPTIDTDKIRRCPRNDGYIIAKAYRDSIFIEWVVEGVFMGLVERLPGKAPIYHRLCPACAGGHFYALGTSPVLEDLTPARHDS
jgi:hypothetical protein